MEDLKFYQDKMDKTMEVLIADYGTIRAGRANPHVLDKIIAASIRNPIHVTDCALAGAHIATVPYNVIVQMTKHPLTDAGIEKFQKDYRAVFGE